MGRIGVDVGVDLHYQAEGSGETVVLIHGLGANLAFWYPFVFAHLERDYQVISYDLRGHGLSSLPPSGYGPTAMLQDLRMLLERLEIPRAHLIGHSYGGQLALRYAIDHPTQVNSLVILDSHLACLQSPVRLRDWPYWQKWKQDLLRDQIPLPEEDALIDFQLLSHLNELACLRGQPSVHNRRLGQRAGRRWQTLMRKTTAVWELGQEFVDCSDLRRLQVPTLGIYGEFSHCLPSAQALGAWAPHTQVVVLNRAAHFYPVSQPGRFLPLVQEFLQARPLGRAETRKDDFRYLATV